MLKSKCPVNMRTWDWITSAYIKARHGMDLHCIPSASAGYRDRQEDSWGLLANQPCWKISSPRLNERPCLKDTRQRTIEKDTLHLPVASTQHECVHLYPSAAMHKSWDPILHLIWKWFLATLGNISDSVYLIVFIMFNIHSTVCTWRSEDTFQDCLLHLHHRWWG